MSLTFEPIPYILHPAPIKTLYREHGQELRGHRGGRAAARAGPSRSRAAQRGCRAPPPGAAVLEPWRASDRRAGECSGPDLCTCLFCEGCRIASAPVLEGLAGMSVPPGLLCL